MSESAGHPDLGALYRATQARLAALIGGLSPAELETNVPACPAWSVRQVLAHLFTITDEVLAGRLDGPPDDDLALDLVRAQGDRPAADLVAAWTQNTPAFSERVTRRRRWPAVIDIASHEQDIRGAVGQPGARDCAAIRICAPVLIGRLESPVPMRITMDGRDYQVGPQNEDQDQEPGLELATERFEAFRWRLGRRSRAQLAALDWSGDPAPVLDHLAVFGPADRDIIE